MANANATSSPAPSAHTPGPWIILGESPYISGFCIGPHGLPVAHVEDWIECRESDRDEARANARLIAAAPELLRLCRQYASDCDTRLSLLQDDLDAAHTSEEQQRDLLEQGDGYAECHDIIDQIDHWRATKDRIQAVIAEL